MVSRAGDWWVIDESGERGVRDDRFRALYEHVSGDLYARRGHVRARRVDTAERVETLEGPADAAPGDWVVDDGASQWPVPGGRFPALYEAAEPS